jgi:hypothetical protein
MNRKAGWTKVALALVLSLSLAGCDIYLRSLAEQVCANVRPEYRKECVERDFQGAIFLAAIIGIAVWLSLHKNHNSESGGISSESHGMHNF